MSSKLRTKIDVLFDELQMHLENQNYVRAEIVLGKLSLYVHMFTFEDLDYYQYAQELIDDPEGFCENEC